MRLRHILEQATSLASAKGLWEASNNTDSMNYMLTSSTETAALAVEAIGGRFAPTAPHAAYSAFFTANDTVEAHATCAVGTDGKAGECGTGAAHAPLLPGGRAKRIGSPKPEAVWRTNHALHPTVLATQVRACAHPYAPMHATGAWHVCAHAGERPDTSRNFAVLRCTSTLTACSETALRRHRSS